MLRHAFFIAREDLKTMLRGKETLLWLFVMPPVFFYFIGTVTGGMSGGDPAQAPRIRIEAGVDAGFLAERLASRLEQQGYQVVWPTSAEPTPAAGTKIVLPAGFTESVVAGSPVTVTWATGAAALSRSREQVRLTRAVYTLLADVVATLGLEGGTSPDSLAALDAVPRTLRLEVESAGERQELPSGFEQSVPGILVMFTLVVLLSSGATTLVLERRQGLLRRLASTPISRSSIVLGKWWSRMALGLVQVAFGMLVGRLLFGYRWETSLPMVVLLLVAWAAVCASLGLLLGCVARTEAQAAGIGVLTANVLAALGGCWWPAEIMPDFMVGISRLLPTGWAITGLHRLINFQAGAAAAVPYVAALALAAFFFAWLAVQRFRYD